MLFAYLIYCELQKTAQEGQGQSEKESKPIVIPTVAEQEHLLRLWIIKHIYLHLMTRKQGHYIVPV